MSINLNEINNYSNGTGNFNHDSNSNDNTNLDSAVVRDILSKDVYTKLKKKQIRQLISEVSPSKQEYTDLESMTEKEIKEININRGIILLSRKIFGPFLLGAFPLTYDVNISYRKFDEILKNLGISETRRDSVRLINSLNHKELSYTNNYGSERGLYFNIIKDETKHKKYLRIRLTD